MKSRKPHSILRLMKVRNARIPDARSICSLINFYAEHDKMLFRSMAEIYENLQTFFVAEWDNRVIGCCALEVIWSDLAEIKSLAVASEERGKGVGKALVKAALDQARVLGVPRVFALTLEPGFFERLGFTVVKKEELPMKVWSDCARCPKQDECDETAVILDIPPAVQCLGSI
ncbi:MAG TPA: N-acetyltransferase [Sedimentisphaerales bacterium]|nr:N-acetyltransferase [Sedimentisphaerales bacterium]